MDSREASKQPRIRAELEKHMEVNVEFLETGDFVVSEECAVERKSVNDFVSTLTQRDLFGQLFTLRNTYPKSFVILEGYLPAVYKYRRVHPASVHGAMFALAKCGIPIIPTSNWKDTVGFLRVAVKQEQEGGKGLIKLHSAKKFTSVAHSQVYFLGSLPKLGRERATAVLEAFDSPLSALQNTSKWKKVESIGKKIREAAEEVLLTPYSSF